VREIAAFQQPAPRPAQHAAGAEQEDLAIERAGLQRLTTVQGKPSTESKLMRSSSGSAGL